MPKALYTSIMVTIIVMAYKTIAVMEATKARFDDERRVLGANEGRTIEADEFLGKLLDMYETGKEALKQIG